MLEQPSLARQRRLGEIGASRSDRAVGSNLRGLAAFDDGQGFAGPDWIAESLEDLRDRAGGPRGQDRLAARRGGHHALRQDLARKPAG